MESPAFQTTIDTGYSSVDEDRFLAVMLHQHVEYKGLELIAAAPLRFRLVDNHPSNQSGILREQDWDESADFGRIIPKLYFGRDLNDGFVAFSFGELSDYTMGKGTMLAHFFNNVEIDHYKPGVAATWDWHGNGGFLIVDNIIVPTAVAGRLYLTPVAWFSSRESSKILEIAATVAGGISMPFVYHDSKDRNIFTAGGELIFHSIDKEKWILDLYSAAMAMDGDSGFHVGIDNRVALSTAQQITLSFLGEYRFVGHDYHPALFNPFYEKIRLDFMRSSGNAPLGLADHLSYESDLPGRHGMMFETSLEWEDRLKLCVRYDREGRNRPHWVLMSVDLTPHPGYHFRLFYSGYDATGQHHLLGYDNLMAIAFRVSLWKPFDILGHFSRRFRRMDQVIHFANEILGGLGFALRY